MSARIRLRPSASARQVLFLSIAIGLFLSTPAVGQTVTFEPKVGVQTFAVREPVLRIKPGTTVETRTFTRPGDYYDPKTAGPWPGEVGPFHIEGAEPGDQLVVRVLRLRPNQDVAISNVTPGGISGVAADSRTRLLNDPLPPRRFVWRLDRTRNVGVIDLPNSRVTQLEIPLRPMLGRVATEPAGQWACGGLCMVYCEIG